MKSSINKSIENTYEKLKEPVGSLVASALAVVAISPAVLGT